LFATLSSFPFAEKKTCKHLLLHPFFGLEAVALVSLSAIKVTLGGFSLAASVIASERAE